MYGAWKSEWGCSFGRAAWRLVMGKHPEKWTVLDASWTLPIQLDAESHESAINTKLRRACGYAKSVRLEVR
jgi:hypothetical protein